MADFNRPSYINKEVAEISGMDPKTVAYYSNHDMVNPTVKKAKGRGSNRRYSSGDVLKYILIPVLSHHGLTLKKIVRLFDLLKRDLFSPSNPFLYHGMPNQRAFVEIYDITQEDFTARMVFPPDWSATYIREVRAKMKKNLQTIMVDMLNHKSILVIDITDCIRKLPVVEE
jgi:DNA-binding transcriptional MerR regulator